MKKLKRNTAICLVFLLITNNIILAKPNYTYNLPSNAQTYTKQTKKTSVSEKEKPVSYDELYPEISDEILSGSVTKTNSTYGENLNDIQAKNKISEIGTKLMKDSAIDKKVSFKFSQKDIKNASTSIAGKVTIYRGILDQCELEDELAFIIGHELAHAAKYHVTKSVATSLAATTAAGAAGDIIYEKTDSTAAAITGMLAAVAAGFILNKKYSRVHEYDADTAALDYMVKSGYNPLAGISILYKIGKVYPDFFSTHPSTDNRNASIYKYVKSKYPQFISKPIKTEAYQNALAEIKDKI